jgi:hypothetical protein
MEEVRCDEKREMEEHPLEELKFATCEEELHDLGHEEHKKYQASNFLHCCLRLLSDPDVAKKLTQMLVTCMGKELTE